MILALAFAYFIAAALAVLVARRDAAHRPLVSFFAAQAAVFAADATARAFGRPLDALETLRAAVCGLSLFAVARTVFARRSPAIPIALGAAVAFAGFFPLWDDVRRWLHEGAWAAGVLGAMASAWCALRGRDEPRLAQFVVLTSCALGAARLAIAQESEWTGLVPQAFAATVATVAQAGWLFESRRKERGHAGDRRQHLRADERVGDLLDVDEAVRGRAARGARATRSRRES
jgi:hypothetical protein